MSRLGAWRDYLPITALTAADGLQNVLMPLLLADEGYSAAAIGPLMAAVGVASLLSRLPVGAAYRPERARWMLIGSLLVAAGCYLVYPPVVASTPLFLVVRVLHGVASGVATTVNLAYLIDAQPAGRSRARLMGLYGSGMAAGYTIGNLVGGLAGDVFGYWGAFVFGAVFWLVGLSQVLTVPEPRAARAPSRPARPATTERGAARGGWLRALRDPVVVGVMTMSFQLNAIHNVNAVFFPLVAREVGLGLSEIGLTRGLYSLVNAVGRPLSSPLSGRFGAGRVALGGFILQAGIIAGVPFVAFGGLPAFLVMFALAGGGRAVAFTANAIQMAEEIPESRLSRGLSSSLFNAAKDLGTIAGPLIGSSLAAVVGLELMFVAAPALLLLPMGAMLGFRSPPEVRATRATG